MDQSNANNHKIKYIRHLPVREHVGFDSIPDQLVNKFIQAGFAFNILCIGETGIGKSTLMDALFNTSFDWITSSHDSKNVDLNVNTYDLEEKNIKLKLTIVETVGYGDQINRKNSFKNIVDYVDEQLEAYMQEELSISRSLSTYHDTRIHTCLYFISPTGHRLKALDIECMKSLHKKVNIIPIIAKADALTPIELQKFKANIMEDIELSGIEIYKFPTNDASLDESNARMNAQMPFSIIASTESVKTKNKTKRIREYPWGTVETENEYHSDLVKLREMLIHTNMQDLLERTHVHLYEEFRQEHFRSLKQYTQKVKNVVEYYYEEQRKLDKIERQLNEEIQEFNRIKAEFAPNAAGHIQSNTNIGLKAFSKKKLARQSII